MYLIIFITSLLGLYSMYLNSQDILEAESVGIIISFSVENYLRAWAMDPTYASDFSMFKEITGEWHDVIVPRASHKVTCGSKTYNNLFFDERGHFFYLRYNNKSYLLTMLFLDNTTNLLYYMPCDAKETFECMWQLEEEFYSKLRLFNGVLYDPNNNSFYTVVLGMPTCKIIP